MGFLNPLFLLAGTAVVVPVILHLFYRQESKTFPFPAIRYLLRTEKEHARQIRTQQLLLLLLRIAIVVLLVLSGARVHLSGPGGSHDPTALALVLDNSMSTTIIRGGRPSLDFLKDQARQSATGAGHDDVIWVVRAGTPWERAVPGSGFQALAAIDATEPGHGPGDLIQAIERALALVGQSDLPGREVHVFTDLQATAFSRPIPNGDGTPVVVFGTPAANLWNRSIQRVSVGGGIPPLAGRPTYVSVSLSGAREETVDVRLYVGDQVRATAPAPVGTTLQLPVGPLPPGSVEGYVEIDPDALTADDRRYFSFTVRDPTPVAVFGNSPFFLTEALAVLEDSDRIVLGEADPAVTIVSVGGEGLERRTPTQGVVVFPLADPARLPALNRHLANAGIPFRYLPGSNEGSRIASAHFPVNLTGLEISRFFPVVPIDGPLAAAGTGSRGNGDRTRADSEAGGAFPSAPTAVVTLTSGDPWLLAGTAPAGPYVLLASPVDEPSTSLPVSAAMIPLLEWSIDRWLKGGGEEGPVMAGSSVRPPPAATVVRDPEGTAHPVDGSQPFRDTRRAGFYRFLAGDSLLETLPVNPPPAEMDLTPVSETELKAVIPGIAAIVDDAASWPGSIFRVGRGPEPWRLLAALLVLLLVAESATAASRRLRSRPGTETPSTPPAHDSRSRKSRTRGAPVQPGG